MTAGGGTTPKQMNREALRAVWRRINALLSTNRTMHDLRSTKDVQLILGHVHLSTTANR